MERLDLVMKIPVTTYLTLDCPFWVVWVPGNLELSMSMRIRPICKVYIHIGLFWHSRLGSWQSSICNSA
jgi:hypothetical protein